MKRKVPSSILIGLVILLIIVGALLLIQSTREESTTYTPVYVTFYSHNEESWDTIVNTEAKYLAYRENLLERLHLIRAFNATLDWQSDWAVLQAIQKYDKGDVLATTNGKNIVRYMEEDLGFSTDPHGHLTIYNYADLEHMLEELGASSTVVGGLQVFECGIDDVVGYVDWHEHLEIQDDGYIYGRVYPEAKWKPEIISVPAFGGHWFDEFSSGVWRPGNEETFYDHSPQNDIIYIGQGYPFDTTLHGQRQKGAQIFAQDAAYIKELVEKIQNGDLPSGELYTASLFITDLDTSSGTEVNEGLRQILEELQPFAERGDIIYAEYETVAEIWQTEYESQPNRVSIEEFSMYPQVWSQVRQYCAKTPLERGTCGDGTCDSFEKQSQQCPDDCT